MCGSYPYVEHQQQGSFHTMPLTIIGLVVLVCSIVGNEYHIRQERGRK